MSHKPTLWDEAPAGMKKVAILIAVDVPEDWQLAHAPIGKGPDPLIKLTAAFQEGVGTRITTLPFFKVFT